MRPLLPPHFARASGIEEDQHDAMTGHASPQVARRYGSAESYPVEALAASVARLKLGKLDLSQFSLECSALSGQRRIAARGPRGTAPGASHTVKPSRETVN